MQMLGREAIIISSICNAKSRAFMAFVGRFAWVCELKHLHSTSRRAAPFTNTFGSAGLPIVVQRFKANHSRTEKVVGVTPINFRNTRFSWDASLNPTASATSAIDRSPFNNILCFGFKR
jgi:hypothetical protein